MARKSRRVVDGGWGWVVVAASFMCNALMDGCVVSVGVIYVHLLDYFEESKSKTALIGSLFVGVALVFGTLSGILVERFGCRTVAILGGLLAAAGFISSAFVSSINVLCFTYGTVAAIGLALVSVPAVVIVSTYFEKKRSFALGIALCGTGFGTLAFPPICELMIQQYSWRGMMLLMGAVVLHFVVGGALFRPQPPADEHKNCTDTENLKHDCHQRVCGIIPVNGRPSVHAVDTDHCLVRSLPACRPNRPGLLMVYSSCRLGARFNSNPALVCDPDISIQDSSTEQPFVSEAKGDLQMQNTKSCPELRPHFVSDEKGPQIKKSALKQTLCNPFLMVYQTVKVTKTGLWLTLFLLHNFVLFFWLDIPYVFLVDRAVLMGIDSTHASFLLSIIGILDTIGQVVYGILGDKPFIDNTLLYGISIMGSGIVVAAYPFCTTYVSMALLSGLFGFLISANYTLCSVLLIEYLGQRTIAVMCGVTMLCQGVGNLSGPPVAGMMFDVLGRYDEAFYVAGICMFLSVIPTYFPYIVQRYKQRDQSSQQSGSSNKNPMDSATSPMLTHQRT